MNNFPMRRQYVQRITRIQLWIGIILSGFIPYLGQILLVRDDISMLVSTRSFVIVALSTMIGYWLIRNFIAYPGVEKSSNVVTAMSLAYAATFTVLIFTRLSYSRFILIGGYLLSVGWFYWATVSHGRRTQFRIGLPLFCEPNVMQDINFVTWIPLGSPAIPLGYVDAVAIDLRADIPDEWERALADFALAGVPVYHIKHLRESLTGQVDLEHISENNFGSLSPVTAYMTLKHLFDWLAAILALAVLSPILLLCGLMIKLDSPGPALFRQCRVGYQGHPFMVYKLRTMTVSASEATDDRDAAMTKDNDSRVTRVGRFLRQTRLDELPQLINIIKGQMSWIGPRPEAEVLGKWYENEIPFYRYRHIVRPGLTGWAQVNQGHVAEVNDVKTKLNFDFYYIKNFSPWLDLLIVIRTIRTVLTGYGAR